MQTTATAAPKAATTWVLDPAHSELSFRVRHMMIAHVKGEFRNFKVDVADADLFRSPIRVSLDPSSIHTNNEQRDAHLKSADFFDVDNHPVITFESDALRPHKDGYVLKGILAIKGIRKEVDLQIGYGGISKDPWGNEKAGFSIEATINRKDWGLNWNAALETGGVLVSDEVKISGEIQFSKQIQNHES